MTLPLHKGNLISKNISLITANTFDKVHSNTIDNNNKDTHPAICKNSSLHLTSKIFPPSCYISNVLNIEHHGSKQSIITSLRGMLDGTEELNTFNSNHGSIP